MALHGAVCSFEQVRPLGEREVERLARLQHDCLHRQQLLAAGIGRGAIAHRVKVERYVRVRSAVYLVRPGPLKVLNRAMAEALHLRGDGVVSHLVAGFVWEMVEEEPEIVELTLVGRSALAQPGVKIHRTAALHPKDVRWRQGLPITSPARTVVDLAGVLDEIQLESVLAESVGRKLTTRAQIHEAIERAPRHAGVGALRKLLEGGGFRRTRQFYERLLLRLIREANLPVPQTNFNVAGRNVDFVWHEQRVIVEFDGFKFHGDRRSFETDRRRDQDLVAAGYRVIRITAHQLDTEPLAVIARLAVILG